jgi:hypothetical protein
MAFSLACDAGETILRIIGADTDVTWAKVFAEGDASVAKDGGGTADVSDWVTECLVSSHYIITKSVWMGDSTNALVFNSQLEHVYFDDDIFFRIRATTTLNLGYANPEGYGINGSFWSFTWASDWDEDPIFYGTGGKLNIYASQWHNRGSGRQYWVTSTVVIKNTIISSFADNSLGRVYPTTGCDWSMEDVFFYHIRGIQVGNVQPTLAKGLWFNECNNAITNANDIEITMDDCNFTGGSTPIVCSSTNDRPNASILNLTNPGDGLPITQATIWHGGGGEEQTNLIYTPDYLVLDQDGQPIEGATVKHYISESHEAYLDPFVWEPYYYLNEYTTDADGLTGEQEYIHENWIGDAEDQTSYKHRLVITAPGQDRMVLDDLRPIRRNYTAQFLPPKGIFYHGGRTRISF